MTHARSFRPLLFPHLERFSAARAEETLSLSFLNDVRLIEIDVGIRLQPHGVRVSFSPQSLAMFLLSDGSTVRRCWAGGARATQPCVAGWGVAAAAAACLPTPSRGAKTGTGKWGL